ncbi:MAG: phosphoribosylanthranilate isomerase [bacterium]
MTKVKICGITNQQDALWAANLGVDFIGLNFFKDSQRKISLDMAKDVIAKLPPFVKTVGIFVNEELKSIQKIATQSPLELVQLHGSETPAFCAELKQLLDGVKIIKAFRVQNEESLASIPQYADCADYYLLDAYVPGQMGGTGEIFNWELAVKAGEFGKPLFLSGGLNPSNIADAVEKVKPFAVDVASGVQKSQRRKDYELMKEFVKKVKGF